MKQTGDDEMEVKNAVNSLVKIKKEIAKLKEKEIELRDVLIANGEGSHEGDNHVAIVSSRERSTLDMKAVREKLSRQFISANTKTSKHFEIKIKEAA